MATLNELRDLRGKSVADARALKDVADKAGRVMSEDEKRQFNSFMDDEKRFKEQIDTEVRLQDTEREMAAVALQNVDESRSSGDPDAEKRALAFRKYVTEGDKYLSADEMRTLTSGADISGGFLNAPQEMVKQLIVNVKNMVYMRQLATIIPLANSTSLGVPTLDTDVGDADWTPEIKLVTEDITLAFGKRELTPHPLSKLVTVSNKLLRSAALNPETIVMDRMSYKFGVAMEKGYMTGSGMGQPLGVFTASADGIPTTRDVQSTAGAGFSTTIEADNLIATKYALKSQYMSKAQWIFHRDAVKQLAQLKSGDGYYLFELSDIIGAPDTLLGRPMTMSEYAPNTFSANQYVGIYGDFSNYWIADSLALQFQRLNELYALYNKVGFIGRLETDGAPVLAEAFARVQLAAS
jgi:HK97 family phage major capsid protein